MAYRFFVAFEVRVQRIKSVRKCARRVGGVLEYGRAGSLIPVCVPAHSRLQADASTMRLRVVAPPGDWTYLRSKGPVVAESFLRVEPKSRARIL